MSDNDEVSARNINIEEDIPGCEDNYYRCVIKCLRISRGWIDFFSTLTLILTAILSAVSAGKYDDKNTVVIFGIVTAIISGTTAALRILRDFTVNDEAQRKELLRQMVSEHRDLNNNNVPI